MNESNEPKGNLSRPPTERERCLLGTQGKRLPRPKRTRSQKVGIALILFALLGTPLMGALGGSMASPATAPSPSNALSGNYLGFGSAFVVGDGSTLVLVGYSTWAAAWSDASNGSQIFTNSIVLVCYDLTTHNVTLRVSITELGTTTNQTILLAPLSEFDDSIDLKQDTSWTTVTLKFDGVADWVGQAATPISFLPPSVLTEGGLDLLVLVIISEAIVAFAAATAIARWLMTRARWAPRFSLLIWGHVILIGIAAMILVDFQWVDATFAGWSPLVYIFTVTPMYFLFVLSFFNKGRRVEILQFLPRPQGKVAFRRWLARIDTLPDGRTILITETWTDTLARAFGKYTVLDDGDPMKDDFFLGDVEKGPSPTLTKDEFVKKSPTDWRVLNPQEDEVTGLMVTDTGQPLESHPPRLTIHRLKKFPPQLSPEGAVLVPAYERTVLTWPHYTTAWAEWHLASEMWAVAAAVIARWATIFDLERVLATVKHDLHLLKSTFVARVANEVDRTMTALHEVSSRTTTDLTEEQAAEEARSSSHASSTTPRRSV